MKITGDQSGQPMKLGVAIVDIVTGLNAVISILSGLIIKNKNLRQIHVKSMYWVTQELPQIYTVILRIRIGKVA